MSKVDEIFELFAKRGSEEYFGEAVSQREHALQAAALAEAEGAPDTLIVAALLHDIGHLVHGKGENIADQGIDGRHEIAGEAWLSAAFGPEVTEPVKLHVAAKRYLCATRAGYQELLSPASILSLELQGGPHTPEEVAAFESNPHYEAAVRLRHWDDEAKIVDLEVPDLEHYRAKIAAVLAG